MSYTPILIVAHAPLAHAFLQGALHVFADCLAYVQALDIAADADIAQAQQHATMLAVQLLHAAKDSASTEARDADAPIDGVASPPSLLILTDVLGASPSNIALRAASVLQSQGVAVRALAGLNLPMLLRAITYRHEPLANMVELASAGGLRGVVEMPVAASEASPSAPS